MKKRMLMLSIGILVFWAGACEKNEVLNKKNVKIGSYAVPGDSIVMIIPEDVLLLDHWDVLRHELEKTITALDEGTRLNLISVRSRYYKMLFLDMAPIDSLRQDEAKEFLLQGRLYGGMGWIEGNYKAIQKAYTLKPDIVLYVGGDIHERSAKIISSNKKVKFVVLWPNELPCPKEIDEVTKMKNVKLILVDE
ncbi:MAG: hypothetical protein K8S55_08610 [Phycisphaerae bacterium]|nr:hypothetical protein [Phycisphaerae bacterium]